MAQLSQLSLLRVPIGHSAGKAVSAGVLEAGETWPLLVSDWL